MRAKLKEFEDGCNRPFLVGENFFVFFIENFFLVWYGDKKEVRVWPVESIRNGFVKMDC